MNKLSLVITSDLSNIHKVENFIEESAKEFKLTGALKKKMTLPVIEAVNNSILFGNEKNPQKLVTLSVFKSRQKLIFTVEDEGKGFDFKNISNPTSPENLIKATGRGMYLMTQLTDELLFTKNGAKVIMIFFLDKSLQ